MAEHRDFRITTVGHDDGTCSIHIEHVPFEDALTLLHMAARQLRARQSEAEHEASKTAEDRP
jgi:hypothetical protein